MPFCGFQCRIGNRWMSTRSTRTEPESLKWWNDYSLLLRYNKARVPFIQNGIYAFGFKNTSETVDKNRLDGIKILEVGCGGGMLSEELARLGAEIIGIDIDAAAIEAAKKHQALDKSIEHNLKYINTSIEEHEKHNQQKYDVLVISEVIEHPGGSLFMTTPSKTFISRIAVVHIAELFKLGPKGIHDYKEFISSQDLTKMIENSKCVVRSIRGIMCNPLRNTYHISSNKSLFYAIHAVKVI